MKNGHIDKEGMKMQALVIGGTGGMVRGLPGILIKQEQIKKVILGDIHIDTNRVQDTVAKPARR